MKFIILILCSLITSAALADCYTVSDPDHRAYCLAKTKGDRSICYSIQKSELRASCLAEVQR